MRRNIVISLESDSIAPVQSITELAPISEDYILAEKSKENRDEPVFYAGTPLQTDRWIYRIVVGALALTLVSSIAGTVWLQANDKDIPEILIALGTGALGGLAGLLAPTPSKE